MPPKKKVRKEGGVAARRWVGCAVRIVPYFVSDVFCERYNYGVVICCGNSSLLHLLFSDTGNGHSTLYKVDPYTFRGLRDWILDVRCLLFWALYIDLQLSRLR